ncbi:glutaredoxin-like protein NrdH [Leucobacter sp. wl10]|uniref:glutaredoxin-like protein NrdH n=1 Tax=Leucobacter sp. wl10 TaxID=2304677 RepID=UPI000E5BA939|nr:glutaredoxin-like protein NrdH [Leucobacter sp. wl10]RGE19076.1 glutaredoxin-like protein NrdH [Leucobacter sp. wl10]
MDKPVIVYSTPRCMQCQLTYRALDEHGIPYQAVDLSESEEALAYVTEELGYSSAPVVVVSDCDHWVGFRPDHIDRIATNH